MIISHKYKFIFFKTNKTAGTSIEIALSKFCGSDDVITPIPLEDEEIRRHLGYRGPQNHKASLEDYILRKKAKVLLEEGNSFEFKSHISAKRVKKHIKKQIWDSYYKFCFERNPWDRVISLYYWRCKSEPRPTISEFLESGVPLILKRRGIKIYTINGQIAVDKVCRYEAINEELEAIRTQVGIPEKLDLPHAKSKSRKSKKSYRGLLDEEQQAKIAELFQDEISMFGYEF